MIQMKEMNVIVREGKTPYRVTESHSSKSEFRKSLNDRGLVVITRVWLSGEPSPMEVLYNSGVR
jgi:hypothetical protein